MSILKEISYLVIASIPPEVVYFMMAVIMIILVILILGIYEKKLNKGINTDFISRNSIYMEQLKKIKSNLNIEKPFEKINIIARDFFKEKFNLNQDWEYTQFEDEFRKRGLDDCEEFSRHFVELVYAGEKINPLRLRFMIEILEEIIGRYKIEEKRNHNKIKK
ncbi:MAG: hypothetical protein WCP89_04665 [archaeon]